MKGKVDPVPIFRPTKKDTKSVLWDKLKQVVKAPRAMYGRQVEMDTINELLTKQEGALFLLGDAGIGKSVLLDYAQMQARSFNLDNYRGAADALDQSTPFLAWKSIIEQLFGLHKMRHKPEPQRRQHVSDQLTKEVVELGKKIP